MARTEIPNDIAAKILFLSDRTCCVCRKAGKSIQIHHIDGNHNNHKISNLCVLCLDCHTETQITGGFSRKLSPEQVVLYRDDWHAMVTSQRATSRVDQKSPNHSLRLRSLATEIEAFTRNENYFSLAVLYHVIGNNDLRDKYIELALKENPNDDSLIIFLRGLQGKIHQVPQKVKQGLIDSYEKSEDWSELARTYLTLGDYKKSIEYYCKFIIKSLNKGNLFTTAFYLKELSEESLYNSLFEEDYQERVIAKDLWWQIRCLEELGWEDEIKETLVKHKNAIEKSGDYLLKQKLYQYTAEEDKYLDAVKKVSENTFIVQRSNRVYIKSPKKKE